MDIELEKLPVYSEPRDTWTTNDAPIGHAANKREAAKLIRAHTGDPDYKAGDVEYSPSLNAYFPE